MACTRQPIGRPSVDLFVADEELRAGCFGFLEAAIGQRVQSAMTGHSDAGK